MTIDRMRFWEYSYSNFLENANRGALAEYIVASALDISESPLSSWESYDLKTNAGIKIEVKASGYLQTWFQKRLSTPNFGIAQKQGWIGNTNDLDGNPQRHADVYIFCLHHEKGSINNMDEKEQAEFKKSIDPLNTDNWTFWIVPTSTINEKLSVQKTVGISTIETVLGANAVGYHEIAQELLKITPL